MPFSCHSFLSALSMWLTGNTQSALDCSQATHSLLWTIPRNMAHRQHTVCSGLFPQSPKHGSQATHTVCSGLFTGNTHGLLWTVPQNWMLAIPYYTSIGSCCKHLFRAPIFDDRSHTNVLAAVKCTLVCNEEPATSLGLARTVYVHRI